MSKKNVLTIRTPEDLKNKASLQGVSINQFALYAFTKCISEMETSRFFQNRIGNKTKEKIENDFLKVWNKLSKKESTLPDWDSLE